VSDEQGERVLKRMQSKMWGQTIEFYQPREEMTDGTGLGGNAWWGKRSSPGNTSGEASRYVARGESGEMREVKPTLRSGKREKSTA